ncbi:uncharacterized protein CELE_F18E9.7 [Caenorhabditis elegans]|uniref:Secreted protein n=1 Tax=Caenorhabditis elegans TaxID=6239 RepID=H8W3Y6_CAEEL|nr:Secreted protein [Caenorhabditis elegans]CCG28152.1 Secreted protein [Caenorhabditis elegans]|eukprot:NP_001257064.1 Uncharacterized protein CELE_F18E9.7 [Caenorhabditis elegans]
MHLTLPTLLFLCFGFANAGVVFSRSSGAFDSYSGSGDFGGEISDLASLTGQEDYLNDHSDILASSNNEVYQPLLKSQAHVVKSPLDDEDLALVQEYFEDQIINKTGQLKYSTLAGVEKSLIKDLVRIIMKDDEYMLLLNNPSFPKVLQMIKSMLREPIQQVLQQQIWSKVLAVQAYYKKFYQPLNNPSTKREALEFLKHLKSASEDKTLTVDDTVKLNEKMQTLAFLVQEHEFDEKISELESMLKSTPREFKRSHHVRKSAIPDKGKPQNSTHPPTLASGNSSEIKVNEKQKLVSPVTTPVATTASPKSRTTTVIVNQQKSFIPNSSIDLKPSSNVISEVKLEGVFQRHSCEHNGLTAEGRNTIHASRKSQFIIGSGTMVHRGEAIRFGDGYIDN